MRKRSAEGERVEEGEGRRFRKRGLGGCRRSLMTQGIESVKKRPFIIRQQQQA